MRPFFPAPFLGLAAALSLGACQRPTELAVTDAWVRLPAVPGRPAAAYFTVTAANAETLVGVATPVAGRTELHETADLGGGRMSMRMIDRVAIEPGMPLSFGPGGRHVMLFDLTPQAMQDPQTTLTLRFESGRTAEVDAPLVRAGEQPPTD